MKKISITVEHDLTPFHEESMKGMLDITLTALENFWNSNSKKGFSVKIHESNEHLSKSKASKR